ncbi:hypothetical protein FACS189459_1180 [Bacilli bacterium]|nr:hypothetical protein FACS189459_1180 [Bacilli bacterium]
MNIIDGKIISRNILEDLKHKLKNMSIIPKLVIIQVGDNQASNVYVRNKLKLSNEVGINTVIEKLPENTSQDDLIKLLNKLNNDKDINGILVQLPLPKHIDESLILESINPNKDVDCFNSKNVGKL